MVRFGLQKWLEVGHEEGGTDGLSTEQLLIPYINMEMLCYSY